VAQRHDLNALATRRPICRYTRDHHHNRLAAVGLLRATIACNHRLERQRWESVIVSLTIRTVSAESKERLPRRAERRGCRLETMARSILHDAAGEAVELARFRHDLIAVIEPFLRDHGRSQRPVELL